MTPGFPNPKILRLDISGTPMDWLSWQEAAVLYSLDKIAWTAGDHSFDIHGGTNRDSGLRSLLTLNSIIATRGQTQKRGRVRKIPPLTNGALFLRDGHLCMYCGQEFPAGLLTRDHVRPISQGGVDRWKNVVTACRACNTRKGGRTPEQAHMPLLAIPFTPNHAEYLALSNRRILGDQMAFLKSQFGHHGRSRLS